jgi:hypothetical protein
MSLINIPIPFNNGSMNPASTDQDLAYNTGQKYTYVGGNNGQKYMSFRFQSNPSNLHVHIFEYDTSSSSPVLTNLGGLTHAVNLDPQQHSRVIEAVRLNTTTVYLRLFTGRETSRHLLIEMDESDHSTTVTEVTPSSEGSTRLYIGGAYSYSQQAHRSQGAGLWHVFMHNLKENSIVMLCKHQIAYRGYSFVQVDFDPVTKALTYKTMLHGGGDSYLQDRAGGNLYGNGNSHDFILADEGSNYERSNIGTGVNLAGFVGGFGNSTSSVSTMSMHYIESGGKQVSVAANSDWWPYNQSSHWEYVKYATRWTSSQDNKVAFITTADSRDGNEIHFSLYGVGTSTTTSALSNSNRSSMNESKYVITYVKDTDTWRVTSRNNSGGNIINTNTLGCWLPLNTVPSSTLGLGDFNKDAHHCDTWINVGAAECKVLGSTEGGVLDITDETKTVGQYSEVPTTSSRSLQAMWLNEDHFIVIWCKNPSHSYHSNQQTLSYNMNYTVVKYVDENIMEALAHGAITGYEDAPDFSYADLRVFQKTDQFTLISDKFSRIVTISAPE